jgi:non-specific serine/threonine protein kinase/serine/threonine-protein kinase
MAFLRKACGDNPTLYYEVAHLIELHMEAEAIDSGGTDPFVGQRVGPYEIVRLIGVGGMGRVYLASRADGAFSRDVAVKIIDPGQVDEEMVARFEQERRLLGALRHPCIAELFDAGRTRRGELYFVMEYVDGVSIVDYCNQRDLSLRNRVSLFARACEAVAAAHEHLIVHRDLKPGNILVDSAGTPKLVDFGIAKPITAAGLEASDPTGPGRRRATPAYASPEQLEGYTAQPSMDIFSLGVVLHELLTGTRPQFATPDDTTTTATTPVPRASAALEHLLKTPSGAEPTASRGTPSGIQPRDLEGDLDAILLKGLDPNPRRRYRSVESLANDLHAYLTHSPVSAREFSLLDRTAKFARRNPVLLIAAVVTLAAITVSVVSLARLWLAASRDRDRAHAELGNQKALASAVLALDADLADLPGGTDARRRLVDALSSYLAAADAARDPALALDIAEGHRRLGDILGNPNSPNLGELTRAVSAYDAALAILEGPAQVGSNSAGRIPLLIKVLTAKADVLAGQGTMDVASSHYTRALSLAQELVRSSSERVESQVLLASVERPLGDLKLSTGDSGQALEHFQRALAIDTANVSRSPHEPEYRRLMALSYFRIGAARAAQGRLDEARTAYTEATRLLKEVSASLPRRHALDRELAVATVRLGVLLEGSGDRSGREAISGAADRLRALAAADPSDTRVRRDLIAALVHLGDVVRAGDETRARQAYSEARQVALALTVAQPTDAQARRDLGLVDRRLSLAARGGLSADLRLFKVIEGKRLMIMPGDPPLLRGSRITATATAAPGWSRYLLVFGAAGAAQLVPEAEFSRADWSLPVQGPPPSQTVLLIASPRPLSDDERTQVTRDVGTIEGPRVVDPDAQILWTPIDEAIESQAASRGSESIPWVRAVRERLGKLGSVAVAGRTFPLAQQRRP